MPCTLVTLLGMHSEYAGLEPARVTPHAANDNLTQLTGHARPCFMATNDMHYSSNSTRQLASCILASSWRCSWAKRLATSCISLTSTVLLNLTSDYYVESGLRLPPEQDYGIFHALSAKYPYLPKHQRMLDLHRPG